MPLTILPGVIGPDRRVHLPGRWPYKPSGHPPTMGSATGVFGFVAAANGFVPGVQMVNREIVAASDDGVELNPGSSDTSVHFMLATAVGDHWAFRFTDLPYQQGTLISDARVNLQLDDTAKNDAEGTWYADYVDDSETLLHGVAGEIDGRAKTTATVAWTTNDLGVAGTWVTSPNLSAVIQEVVDRAGWEPGNNVTLIYVHNSTADKITVRAFDLGLGSEATFYSEYQLIPQELGVCTGHFGFVAAAAGVVTAGAVTGQATGSFTFTGAVAGVGRTPGQAAGTYTFTGAVTGVRRRPGTAVGTFTFTGAVAGVGRTPGQAIGTWTFTGTVAGRPRVVGVAVGAFIFTGAAEGDITIDAVTGVATGIWGYTGTASGLGRTYGAATGLWGYTGSVAGVGRTPGTAAGVYTFTGTTNGVRRRPGTATGTFTYTGLAVGLVRVKGVLVGAFIYAGDAAGFVPSAEPLVTPAERIETVGPEQRTLTAEAEDRTVIVPTPTASRVTA